MEKIWLKNYPQNVSASIDPDSYQSINDLFSQCTKKYNTKTAYINMGVQMTFEELDTLSTQLASFFQNQAGLQKGDRIALQMPNILQYPVAIFAAFKAGLIVVNTNPLYTEHEMEHQFTDSGVKAIVILANFADKLQQIIDKTAIETVIVTELGDLLGWPKSFLINMAVKHIKKMVPSYTLPGSYSFYEALDIGKNQTYIKTEVNNDDIAFLQYTGGTTGVAKGAMLSHRNIVANMLQVSEWMKPILDEGKEVALTPLPLYHIFSLTVNCLTLINYGAASILITNPKDMPSFLKTMKKYKFTLMTGVNTLFNGLLNQPEFHKLDFSNLKVSVAGGMALQTSVAEKWQKVTQSKIIEGYGLTETSPVTCCNPIDNIKTGSIGMPFPSTDIKIIDDNGEEVGLGERGELCIKGPQVMKGYWQQEEETKNVLDTNGWLKTGDIAVYDEDGYFKIVDRKKDMILVSGFNVFPNEVEDAIALHPKVDEVAAIGIPDEKSGEVVKVFITTKDKSLDEEEIKAFCKENLAGYKCPKVIEFREELPKSNVGKILRRMLKED